VWFNTIGGSNSTVQVNTSVWFNTRVRIEPDGVLVKHG